MKCKWGIYGNYERGCEIKVNIGWKRPRNIGSAGCIELLRNSSPVCMTVDRGQSRRRMGDCERELVPVLSDRGQFILRGLASLG